MKKFVPVLSGILSAVMLLAIAGCVESGQSGSGWHGKDEWLAVGTSVPEAAAVLPTSPVYREASVHDPSVFHDPVSGKYYAFGSHFSVASTEDFISWTQEIGDGSSESSGQQMAQKLYGQGRNWRDVLKQAVEHCGSGMPSTWAPDVEFINGRYYMYFSLTSAFGSNKSCIGRVSSNDVLGPYDDEEILVYTNGLAGEPNAIDPELFYDKEGKLWLVYGSHYAGVYIKELNADGLPVVTDPMSPDYYGKLLWKGGAKVVEGPFVFYNAETDYYYLMTTYGDLTSDYNMRIARSKNPDGPYTDIAGKDLAASSDNGNLNGNKLAGNYHFSGDRSWAAMGHNSVVKVGGKYLVVHHTRWGENNAVSLPHTLNVRQLYFNEEGWPVLAPNRYAGEEKGLITAAQAAGDYDVILHTETTTAEFAQSVRYTFTAEGKVMNGETEAGTWSMKDDYYVSVTIDNVTYNGVAAVGWNNYAGKGVISFTATSNAGRALWANGVDSPSL